MVSILHPPDLESIDAHPDPPHSTSLPTDHPLSTVGMDTSTFVLDLLIAHQEGKRSCTQYLIFNYVSYDHLTPLSHQFAMFVSSVSIPKSYQEALMYSEWKHVMDDKRMLSSHVRLEILCLLPLDYL